MRKIGRRLACFLFLLLGGAAASLAGNYRLCVDSGNCHNCDYYDLNGDYLYSIYWCTYS
jgi:hypothetical protein